MKSFWLFLTFIAFELNSNAQSKSFVPLEYEYPKAMLFSPKTYVYKNSFSTEIRYKDVYRKDSSGQIIINWKEYVSSSPLADSAVEVNDRTIENYLMMGQEKIKESITEDSLYNDGSKLGEKVQSGAFAITPSLMLAGVIRSHYLKDTVMTWQGKNVSCIVIESNQRQIVENPQDASQRKEMLEKITYYFGKDVGLLRYTTKGEEGFAVWDLAEIKDIKH